MEPDCSVCGKSPNKCSCFLSESREIEAPPKVLEFKTATSVDVMGTVGFKVAFVWFEIEKNLGAGSLNPEELRRLGLWCLATADRLES